MAKYTVTCPRCETDYRVDLIGPSRDREWKLDNFDWTCDECREKAQAEENAAASAANAASGLPALTGSEKMIAWAETIRKQKIITIDDYIERYTGHHPLDERLQAAIGGLKNRTSARWWIDNRDRHVEQLLREEYAVTEKPLPPEDKKAAEEAKAEALAEATVRPPKPVTETVAEIRISGPVVEILFSEKREDFRQIVRFQLGYTWAETRWRRQIELINGTPEDRAAEAGNRLLAGGFSIRIFDDSLRVRAVYGTYEPEAKRWVMALTSGSHVGWFIIKWPREEDFYKAAKRIHGARYAKPSIIVPPEQFAEVLDFAEMYKFGISAGAQRVIAAARQVREKALTASPSVPSARRLPAPGEVPSELAVPADVGIADEFMEEEP